MDKPQPIKPYSSRPASTILSALLLGAKRPKR
jgi:hypothetical protein